MSGKICSAVEFGNLFCIACFAMIEKRKKVASHVDEENSHADDVEEYEVKRSTFRHKWGYFAIAILVMIIIYVQFLSNNQTPPPIAEAEKNYDVHVHHERAPVKSEESTFDIKSGRWLKPGEVAPPPKLPIHPIEEAKPVEPIQSNEEKQNLRKGAAVAHGLATNEVALQTKVDAQIAKIRHMKFQEHIVMEKSAVAKEEIGILQGLLRSLIQLQYGTGPYKVEMRVLFPASMEKPGLPQEESIFIEMAPISLVPYSVYNFLEIIKNYKVCFVVTVFVSSLYNGSMFFSFNPSSLSLLSYLLPLIFPFQITRSFFSQGGVFHRNAGHVLQAQINTGGMQGLAFQEYHPDFPHKQYTMGYAGES